MLFGLPQKLSKWNGYSLQVYRDYQHCYISKRSVLKMFGYSQSLNWLTDYLETFRKFTVVPEQLLTALKNPVTTEVTTGTGKKIVEEMYPTEILFDLCHFIAQAKIDGFIGILELKIAQTAQSILEVNQSTPLESVISETTGYRYFQEKQISKIAELLAVQCDDASYLWAKSLPTSFLEHFMEIAHLDWQTLNDNLPTLSGLLQRNFFLRLPETLHQTLKEQKPKRTYRRKGNQPQKIENARLQEIISIITGLVITSGKNQTVLTQLLDKIYPIRPKVSEKTIVVPQIRLSKAQTEIRELLF